LTKKRFDFEGQEDMITHTTCTCKPCPEIQQGRRQQTSLLMPVIVVQARAQSPLNPPPTLPQPCTMTTTTTPPCTAPLTRHCLTNWSARASSVCRGAASRPTVSKSAAPHNCFSLSYLSSHTHTQPFPFPLPTTPQFQDTLRAFATTPSMLDTLGKLCGASP